ncbi:hypothetical protein Tco_0035625 [Tanacetum coccineum]
MLFSIHSDDGNPSRVNIKQHRDLPPRCKDYQDKDCQGRLLSSFHDDGHVGTKTQDRKMVMTIKTNKEKDLRISELKTKSKDKDKGSRSKITQHEGTSLQQR